MKSVPTLIVILTILTGCGEIVEPGSTHGPKTELLEGLFSYSTREEISELVPASLKITVIEDSTRPPRGKCPQFDIYSISAAIWRHLDTSGSLEMSFVNNALYRTSFYPDDVPEYLSRLNAAGIQVSSQTPEKTIGNSVIMYATNWQNREYVSWADRKIQGELNSWIGKCA